MQIIIVRYLSSVWTLKNTYPETKVKPDCLKWYYLLGNGWALSSESACLFVFYLKYTESEKVVWKGVCIDHWWSEKVCVLIIGDLKRCVYWSLVVRTERMLIFFHFYCKHDFYFLCSPLNLVAPPDLSAFCCSCYHTFCSTSSIYIQTFS